MHCSSIHSNCTVISIRGHLQTKNFTLNVKDFTPPSPPPSLTSNYIKLTFLTLGGDPGMPFWPLRKLRTTSLHLHANVMLICQRPPPPPPHFSVTMTLSVKILVCRCPLTKKSTTGPNPSSHARMPITACSKTSNTEKKITSYMPVYSASSLVVRACRKELGHQTV